jgi:dTDP-4-amino-4,6-dideoxygalactose transaminase
MLRKIPIAAPKLSFRKILYALVCPSCRDEEIKKILNTENIFFTNSGTSALYVILKALKQNSQKDEVIIPAYTSASLLFAIKKAGLTPVLCDINTDELSLDGTKAKNLIGKNTLALIAVHMFGIVNKSALDLKNYFPDLPIIEDCAQSMGSMLDGKLTGTFTGISFFSFNRGKNMSAMNGGAIAVSDSAFAQRIEKEIDALPKPPKFSGMLIAMKLMVLKIITLPYVYGALDFILKTMKEKMPPDDFKARRYTCFQVKLISLMISDIRPLSEIRYRNAIAIAEKIRHIPYPGASIIAPNMRPAPGRLPVLCKNRDELKDELRKFGIEASPMYYMTLNQRFNLGYKNEDFPCANMVAEKILALPVHYRVTERDIEIMVKLIQSCCYH